MSDSSILSTAFELEAILSNEVFRKHILIPLQQKKQAHLAEIKNPDTPIDDIRIAQGALMIIEFIETVFSNYEESKRRVIQRKRRDENVGIN